MTTSISGIAGLALDASPTAATPFAEHSGTGAGFSQRLHAEISAVNDQLVGAENSLRTLASGEVSNLHHVMLELEEARLSFQLLVQVRNKVLDGYQELMRMQI
jgi:flagellar hook-basal body complex protein FliE